jgi:esterase/lipase superfamily enzyme
MIEWRGISDLRFGRVLLVTLTLASCAPRGAIVLDPAAGGVGTLENVFVGTTRSVGTAAEDGFGSDRHPQLRFARLDVSVPPDRKAGNITWTRRGAQPDPRTDFLTTSQQVYADGSGFRADLARRLARMPKGNREAVVFVHGFNNTFAEGVYRMAQLGHDLKMEGAAVHYSWPSRAHPLAYVYDRESALFARDGLETLLTEVDRAGADRILLVGHSLGSLVLMEAMRQMKIGGRDRVLGQIGGVILLSPDLDIDVFRAEAQRIGPLPQPFVIFTSRKDRALSVSARLTGRDQRRLGNLDSASSVADLDVTVLDTTAYSEGTGHFNVGDSPALIALLARIADVEAALSRDRTSRTGLLPGVILTFRNATEIVLSPVAVISGYQGG